MTVNVLTATATLDGISEAELLMAMYRPQALNLRTEILNIIFIPREKTLSENITYLLHLIILYRIFLLCISIIRFKLCYN